MKILSRNNIDSTEWGALVASSATGTWFQSPEAYEFYASQPELFKPFAIGICNLKFETINAHSTLRAVVSVPSNIAEGSGRTSAKDQAHFFEMAYGSLMEVDCQIDIAQELGYIISQDVETIEQHVSQIAALLSGLRDKKMKE